jgi:hypothetical protein
LISENPKVLGIQICLPERETSLRSDSRGSVFFGYAVALNKWDFFSALWLGNGFGLLIFPSDWDCGKETFPDLTRYKEAFSCGRVKVFVVFCHEHIFHISVYSTFVVK